MDVIERLKRQHEEVRDVLERIIAEDGGGRETRALLAQVSSALRLHMILEEKIVYPAGARAFAGDEDDEETILAAYEEHAVARRCLEELEGTTPSDRRFVVRAKILKEIFEKHVEEEEGEMFPELEAKLGQDGMKKLGDVVERRLREIEGEVTHAKGAQTARRGQRARAKRAPASAARGARAARNTSGARSRGSKAGRGTRKGGRAKSVSRGNGSRETNGNKPRRGESTSRS
jgi:hemerythrin-like domain-containing protein